jgi:hypothetical protein
MSVTVAHRPRIHMPYKTIVIFLAAAAVAAAVLVLVNQPWEEQATTEPTYTQATTTQAVTVPKPEPWSMLRAHPEMVLYPATTTAATGTRPAWALKHNLLEGLTPESSGYVAQPPARFYAPGEVNNAHPLNFIAGSSR